MSTKPDSSKNTNPKLKKKGEKLVKRKAHKNTEEKLDMEEVEDRILSMKEMLEELKQSKDFIFQFKIVLTTFMQMRARLLKQVYSFKKASFEDKAVF